MSLSLEHLELDSLGPPVLEELCPRNYYQNEPILGQIWNARPKALSK